MRRRTLVVAVAVAVVVSTASTWVAASQIRSPAEEAARTAPPVASPILVPVVEQVLSTRIVTRGTARFGSPRKLRVVPSRLKSGARVVTRLAPAGSRVAAGDVVATISGRPVFVLQGRQPMYRDLGPGMAGRDVRQLERALQRAGFSPGAVDGVYDDSTERAVSALYRRNGFEPLVATAGQVASALPAEAAMTRGGVGGAGVQLPSDEVVFVATAPLRVTDLTVGLGDTPDRPIATVTDSDVVIDGFVRVEQAGKLTKGAEVLDAGARARHRHRRAGRSSVAPRPGTNGADGFHVVLRGRRTPTHRRRSSARRSGSPSRSAPPARPSSRSPSARSPSAPTAAPGSGAPRTARSTSCRSTTGLAGGRLRRRRGRPRRARSGRRGRGRVQGRPEAGSEVTSLRAARRRQPRLRNRRTDPCPARRRPRRRRRASCVAIVGASGSGKTTLLNIIGCLDRPTSRARTGWTASTSRDARRPQRRAGLRSRDARLRLPVLPPAQLPERAGERDARRGVRGAVPDRPGRARSRGAPRGRLEERADALPTQLSGGQRQRVAIARAIVNRPRMLLCDEPTGNLDSVTTSGILELLGELHQDGLTIIVITHDPGVAAWSDRQVHIADGRIRGAG